MTTFANICSCLKTNPDYFLLGTIKANDVPYHIIENLKLCSDEDIEIIDSIIQVLIRQKT